MNNMSLTNDDYSHINMMILSKLDKQRKRGTYFASVLYSSADCVQEMWLTAIKVIKKYGEVNFKIIDKALQYKLIDIIRYCTKEVDHKNNYVEIEDNDCVDTSAFTAIENINFNTDINDLLQAAPENVRKYIRLLMSSAGLSEENKIKRLSNIEIAERLGYSSASCNGYRKLKDETFCFLVKNKVLVRMPKTRDKYLIRLREQYDISDFEKNI